MFQKCLEYYNYVSADVVDAVLSDSLPDALVFLDIEMPLIPPEDSNVRIGFFYYYSMLAS